MLKPDRGSRPHHAEGDGLCDAVRADRGVGGHHGDRLQERPVGAVEAGPVHGRLLPLADDPVGYPGRGRLHRAGAALSPPAAADPRAADDRLLDRELGGGLSQDAGGAEPLRRLVAHLELRAAARLLVQPRRHDDVLHLRRHLHRPDLSHRNVARHAVRHAGDPDDHLQGRGRRAARLAGGDRGHARPVQHPRGRAADDHGHRHLPRHGPQRHQRDRQFAGHQRGRQVGGRARRPSTRCGSTTPCRRTRSPATRCAPDALDGAPPAAAAAPVARGGGPAAAVGRAGGSLAGIGAGRRPQPDPGQHQGHAHGAAGLSRGLAALLLPRPGQPADRLQPRALPGDRRRDRRRGRRSGAQDRVRPGDAGDPHSGAAQQQDRPRMRLDHRQCRARASGSPSRR